MGTADTPSSVTPAGINLEAASNPFSGRPFDGVDGKPVTVTEGLPPSASALFPEEYTKHDAQWTLQQQLRVPRRRQGLIKNTYVAWLLASCALAFNWMLTLAMWASGHRGEVDWLWSALLLCCGVPGGWLLWYSPLYRAARQRDPTLWAWGLLGLAVHVAACAWAAVAPPVVSAWTTGIFDAIHQIHTGGGARIAFGVLAIFNSLLWVTSGFLALGVLLVGLIIMCHGDPA